MICLYRLAERCRFSLQEEVEKKMEVNRSREWNLDGTGCGYHK